MADSDTTRYCDECHAVLNDDGSCDDHDVEARPPVRSGSEALLVYPEGDADTVTVVELHHDGVVVRLPDGGLYTTVLEDIGLGVDDDLTFVLDDGCTTFAHQPTYGLPVDPTDAERRFATFGPEVGSSSVPALVRAGVRVWSFGYGDDPEEFTTIDAGDLWAFDGDDPDADVVDSWAPFRVDARPQAPECLICSIQIGDDPDDDLERMRCSDHSL